MASRGEIKSEKILIKNVFKMWFCIPEYQRPYVWGDDEINDLLDDLTYALQNKPDSEYFLGSFVFQTKPRDSKEGRDFSENDLLDGQQRMATLLLLVAVIRDLSRDLGIKDKCQSYIYQKADIVEKIPERTRVYFSIRPKVQEFIENNIKIDGSTNNEESFKHITNKSPDISVQNMASAVLTIHEFFRMHPDTNPDDLLPFIANNVLMIYVSTEDLEDAFRLFMILNARGIPLRNSDILKSMNLGALDSDDDKKKYAVLWENAEGELGDDFDRFLSYIRTIFVKERARLTLLREYEDKIYNPKETDKTTGKKKPILLKKGEETFQFIDKYLGYHRTLLNGQNDDDLGNFEFDNLIKVMQQGLPATDWVPPLLRYFDKFGYDQIKDFLFKLDNKFSADWISQRTPIDRIEAMNNIIKKIDVVENAGEVIGSDIFDFNKAHFISVLDGPVYGKRFAKYIVLKLDYFYQNHDQKMHFETLSVEHILPQTPAEDSKWIKDFTEIQREELTHKLGNLVSITSRKNAAQGRLDFADKFNKYFQKNIDTCPNSLRVLNTYREWTPIQVNDNQKTVLAKIQNHY